MTRGNLDVIEGFAFSKLGGNFINVRLKVSLVVFGLGPLFLGQQGVRQGALLSNAKTVGTVVSFAGFGNLETTKGFLDQLALFSNQIVVAETFS